MSDNMDLWKRAFTTDPRAVKEITGKQYKGNSPKPYWIVERLTQEFGPCGIGWGFSIVNERMERLVQPEILHVAVVRFWYMLGDKRGELEQVGQTKAVYAKKDGTLMVDEDAPKKSVTDALVKCASYLGFAGDIFSGLWDDSKYVESARQHYAAKEKAPGPQAVQPPKNGAMADMIAALPKISKEWEAYFDNLAEEVCEQFGPSADVGAALTHIDAQDLNNDQTVHLWARLPSNVRTALDKLKDERRKETA